MKQFIPAFTILIASSLIPAQADPSIASKQGCLSHICAVEKQKGIPEGLLEAIGQIESKLHPFTVNACGRGFSFPSAKAAANFVRQKQQQGYRNISVGPMQLHVPSHRRNFKSLEDMLDPKQNIAYAGQLLKRLERQHGSSEAAVRYYHSANPKANHQYKNRVFGAWAKIRNQRHLTPIAGNADAPVYSHKKTIEKLKKHPKATPKIQFNYGRKKG